jgi:hypothetical protein
MLRLEILYYMLCLTFVDPQKVRIVSVLEYPAYVSYNEGTVLYEKGDMKAAAICFQVSHNWSQKLYNSLLTDCN